MATTAPTNPAAPILESPLPAEVLHHLYSAMLKARLLSRRIRNSKPTAEAVLAATLQNLEDSDRIVSDFAHPVLEFLRGAELSKIVGPRLASKNQHDKPARIAAAPPKPAPAIAAGLALSLKTSPSVTVA